MKILFLSKGSNDSGNFSTISRISRNIQLQDENIETFFLRIMISDIEENEYVKTINKWNPNIIIGLNLLRCTLLDKIPLNIRKIMILGGTDINELINQESIIKCVDLIRNCQRIIAFSLEMKLKFQDIYSQLIDMENLQIDIIQQGMDLIDPITYQENKFNDELLKKLNIDEYFLVVGRLRPVKDPGFIVAPFIEWSCLPGNQKYSLLYVGSIEENTENIRSFLSEIDKCSNIFHVDSLPQNHIFHLMSKCKALINCSKNEGQSTTILEAMSIGAPVLARNVPGNIGLIENEYNGLLFSNEREFILSLTKIKEDRYSRNLIENAKEYIWKNHNSTTEALKYLNIIKEINNISLI